VLCELAKLLELLVVGVLEEDNDWGGEQRIRAGFGLVEVLLHQHVLLLEGRELAVSFLLYIDRLIRLGPFLQQCLVCLFVVELLKRLFTAD